MKTLNRLSIVVVLLAVILVASGCASKKYVDSEQLAGSVVMLTRQGQVAYLEAFGKSDREAGRPMETDAIFRIASQTMSTICIGRSR